MEYGAAAQWVIDRYKEGRSHQEMHDGLISSGYSEKDIDRIFVRALAKTREKPVKEHEVPVLRRYGVALAVGGTVGALSLFLGGGAVGFVSAIGAIASGIICCVAVSTNSTDIKYEFFGNFFFNIRAGAAAGLAYWAVFAIFNPHPEMLLGSLLLFGLLGALGSGLFAVSKL